ncbi:hypothetical protein MLD38_017622 [Melastoma candidum]|uniref:Uncharacterized protein n=1 Tax=Melastoma candidum TaxID=119954 RepID=A0ACB9QUQ4_9MYRT|nr:hypothetical protein MLD38_017622 [Melastoma candidum]
MRWWKNGLLLRGPSAAASTLRRKHPMSATSPLLLLRLTRSTFSYSRSFPNTCHASLSFSSYYSCQQRPESQTSPCECWNCGSSFSSVRTTPSLVCKSCRSVQPVDYSIDYFRIFGIEKRYEIEDLDALEGKYKEWQKKLHPDLVHSKSQRERDYAAEQSARVIEAYHTLSKPLSRAIYILKLEGVNINEEETVTDPELLSEIMEIREAVEESADSQALMQIHNQMEAHIKHWSEKFGNLLQDRKFDDCQDCIRRMKYYSRTSEEIVKKL